MADLPEPLMDAIINLLVVSLEQVFPDLQEAIDTGLDPTSVAVGMIISSFEKMGGSMLDVERFVGKEQNRKALLLLREKVR